MALSKVQLWITCNTKKKFLEFLLQNLYYQKYNPLSSIEIVNYLEGKRKNLRPAKRHQKAKKELLN